MKPLVAAGNLSDAVRLDISEKDVFGRDQEKKILDDALDRVTKQGRRPELLMVCGESGTGKSCLVKATLRDRCRQEKRGIFIKGKFDQFRNQRDSYSALTEALDDLCERIDRRDDRDDLVANIKTVLGDELRRLATFIPGLRRLINDDDAETSVEAEGSSYERLGTLSCKLIQSISSHERPIVLFVDDLHWGDTETMNFLYLVLASDESNGLLVVGAYRDDGIKPGTALENLLDRLMATTGENDAIPVTKVHLNNLGEEDVNELIAFATDLTEKQTLPLSRLVHRKTMGNCFFMKQFLEMLQGDGLLFFSFAISKWAWKLDEIAAKTDVSENVADLVVSRIDKLDSTSQNIFKIAGCLGSRFTNEVLTLMSHEMTRSVLDEVGARVDENCSPSKEPPDEDSRTNEAVEVLISMNIFERSKGDWLKFSHDRIQQVASSWMEDDHEKKTFCLQIGRILRKETCKSSCATNQDWIFVTAVDQFNQGASLITEDSERMQLVQLNKEAAEKAKESFAFLPAATYTQNAISLLGLNMWEAHPVSTMELHIAAATLYLKCGRSALSYDLTKKIVEHSSSAESRLAGQFIQLEALEHQRRFDDAHVIGLGMLRAMKEKFPRRPNQVHVIAGFLKTKKMLAKYSDDHWLSLPPMTDEYQLTVCKMIQRLFRILFFAKKKDLLPLLWFRNIKKALQFGISQFAAPGLVMYGTLLGHMKDTKGATRFANLALTLSRRFDGNDSQLIVNVSYYFSNAHWRSSLSTTIDPLMNSYVRGMRIGDAQIASMCAICSCVNYFCCGLALEYLEDDMRKLIGVFQEYDLQNGYEVALPVYQLVLILTGKDKKVADPLELTGQAMNQEAHRKRLQLSENLYAECSLEIFKLWSCAILGIDDDITLKQHKVVHSNRYAKESRADFVARKTDFYGALAAISLYRRSRRGAYLRYAKRIARVMERYVKEGGLNCVHLLLLLQVELLTCQKVKASTIEPSRQARAREYQKAINAATRSGFCQDAALACEKIASFYEEFDVEYANDYWNQAFERHVDWGAGRKLDLLEQNSLCLKKKARTSTATTVQPSGRMNARSRYNQDAVNEHRSLTFL